MKRNLLWLFFLWITSCSLLNEEDPHPSGTTVDHGVITQMEPLWVKEMVTSKETGKLIAPFIYPILHDEQVISPSGDRPDGGWDLVALDIANGEEQWRWSKAHPINPWNNHRNDGKSDHIWIQFDDWDTYEGQEIAIYAIDLTNGNTVFERTLHGDSHGDNAITHQGKFYFHYFPATDTGHTMRPIIFEGDVQTGQFEELLVPKIDSVRLKWTGSLGHVRGITTFEGSNGNDYILIPFSEYQIEEGPEYTWTWGHLYIGLYDLTLRRYVYEKKPIAENVYRTFEAQGAAIYDDRIAILVADYTAFGVDLYTGDILWKRGFSKGGLSFVISDGVLVLVKRDGLDETTYGLDPETGNERWRRKTSTGCDDITELNGVVYWKDRGDGRLYAVEASTGTLLWRLKDPDPEENSWWSSSGVGVLPGENGEKGKIFAASHMRLYCFEAAK